jgi:hypothetical protein
MDQSRKRRSDAIDRSVRGMLEEDKDVGLVREEESRLTQGWLVVALVARDGWLFSYFSFLEWL